MKTTLTSTMPVTAALPLLKAIAKATGKRIGSCIAQANAILNEFAWVAEAHVGYQPATPQGHIIIARQLANVIMQQTSRPLTSHVLMHQLDCLVNNRIQVKLPLTFKN